MSRVPNEPAQPITIEQVEAWLCATKRKRLDLHLQATEPWSSRRRHEAFMAMSELLKEAIEEVRVMSESLQEKSRALRAHSVEVREHAAHLTVRPHRIRNA